MFKKREKSAKYIKKTTKIFKKPEKKIKIENSGKTDKYIEKTIKISKSWQKPPKISRKRQKFKKVV